MGKVMRAAQHSIGQAAARVPARAEARYWQATLARDARADGAFFFGVKSTQIYCRSSCPARRPLRKNTLFFSTTSDAEGEGVRPCRRCKPDEIPVAVCIVRLAAQLLWCDPEMRSSG